MLSIFFCVKLIARKLFCSFGGVIFYFFPYVLYPYCWDLCILLVSFPDRFYKVVLRVDEFLWRCITGCQFEGTTVLVPLRNRSTAPYNSIMVNCCFGCELKGYASEDSLSIRSLKFGSLKFRQLGFIHGTVREVAPLGVWQISPLVLQRNLCYCHKPLALSGPTLPGIEAGTLGPLADTDDG